eukprot:TRINITY_DN311_c0_g2_i1.p1 TRINITY_DN311_c0_g2~~TRINITY_DN311_c0_g2_i1.p1  ORF type:complete len:152 (+),score=19.01 TRINITY_DN311_c0_g2_i1:110-565(+)
MPRLRSTPKNRKKRGHVSAGHGRIGKHRKHPRGRGCAGGQHHNKINFDKYHPGYFGKIGMREYRYNAFGSKHFCPTIPVSKLWSLVDEETKQKYKDDSVNAVVIDVTKHGFHKVLGTGRLPNRKLIVLARFYSEKAEKKIKKVGGAALLTA